MFDAHSEINITSSRCKCSGSHTTSCSNIHWHFGSGVDTGLQKVNLLLLGVFLLIVIVTKRKEKHKINLSASSNVSTVIYVASFFPFKSNIPSIRSLVLFLRSVFKQLVSDHDINELMAWKNQERLQIQCYHYKYHSLCIS